MPKNDPTKITEDVRTALLRRPLVPSVTPDSEVSGLVFRVTRTRSFWSWNYSPHGTNPRTGKRWGSTRYELGDGQIMTVREAHTAQLKAKARVRDGEDPHREKLAQRRSAAAERGNQPQTTAQALELYARSINAKRDLSEPSKQQSIHYATKAVRLLKAEDLSLVSIDAKSIRLMISTFDASASERRHCFGAADRFLGWCRRQGLIERNPTDDIGRDERPKPGRSRDNTPTVSELRKVRAVTEDEAMQGLVHFLLLTPLRREEASGLRWSEVDLDLGRIRIAASRMKNREVHELPLSPPALAILRARQGLHPELVFATPEGKRFDSWTKLHERIRHRIGQSETTKSERFSFHDVRRSFVSTLAERGIPKEQQPQTAAPISVDIDLLDQCLSHTRKGVLGVYQRASRMNDRAAALRAWATYLLDEEVASNVVQLVHGARA